MIDLLLSEPKRGDQGNCESVEDRINILKKMESVIWPLLTSEGRSEVRLWLCKTISCLRSVTPQAQCRVFIKLLRSEPRKLGVAELLLQKIFEKRPRKAGAIIAKRHDIIKEFFTGRQQQQRILQWFGNFAGVGESEHKKGARALCQFAFVNRDICWEELEWKGKHGQSPAVVATKPHYFLDLDVEQTVKNFLEYVPDFWTSDELAESVKDGDILLLDTTFFINCFLNLMYEDDSEDVWEVIKEFLSQESFSSLCHNLLILLEEGDLFSFLNLLSKFLSLKLEPKRVGQPSYWLELLLSMHEGSIDEFLLINALINQGRQLLRLVLDEEHMEERKKLGELVLDFSNTSSVSNAALLKECLKSKKADSLKWLCFQSWILLYRLSEEYKTPDAWEALFIRNGINFRKSSSFDLLDADGLSGESEFSFDNGGSPRSWRQYGKSQKKRRRYYDLDEYDKDELLDMDTSSTQQGLLPMAGNWLLSTDNYSSSWNSVDLPEHLAKHCFSTWMSWLCSSWNLRA